MRYVSLLGLGLVFGASVLSGGCATISKDDCLAGNWAERGLKDGRNGKSRSRLSEYKDKCAKHSAVVDHTTYLREYERGLVSYCVYDKGYDKAASGGSYNSVCNGPLAPDYTAGYEDGKEFYQIKQGHSRLIDNYDETLDDIITIRIKLDNPEVDDKEYRRLEKKLLRLQDRRAALRRDIRDYERDFDLPRYNFN